MWPALLVAAAGSFFLAKKILNQNSFVPPTSSCESDKPMQTDAINIEEESEGLSDASVLSFSSANARKAKGKVKGGERVPRSIKVRSSNKGNCIFGWGYRTRMKSEINRLNTIVSETVKVVQELKDEVSRIKIAHGVEIDQTDHEFSMVELESGLYKTHFKIDEQEFENLLRYLVIE